MNKLIPKYNKLVEEIVYQFAQRYILELYQEPCERSDYDIINYVGINQWPVEINDYYYDIDDILVAEMYQIPAKMIQDWYDISLMNYDNKDYLRINLYNYFRKNTNPALYEKEEAESLERSKENIEYIRTELENCIKKLDK